MNPDNPRKRQKMIDVMFELAIYSARYNHEKTNEEIADWVRAQIEDALGIKTKSAGMSWGVIVNE